MVTQAYMTEHRPPPGRMKRFLDQTVIPAGIDAAGAVEAAVERVAAQIRRSPGAAVGVAAGSGLVVALLLPVLLRRR